MPGGSLGRTLSKSSAQCKDSPLDQSQARPYIWENATCAPVLGLSGPICGTLPPKKNGIPPKFYPPPRNLYPLRPSECSAKICTPLQPCARRQNRLKTHSLNTIAFDSSCCFCCLFDHHSQFAAHHPHQQCPNHLCHCHSLHQHRPPVAHLHVPQKMTQKGHQKSHHVQGQPRVVQNQIQNLNYPCSQHR